MTKKYRIDERIKRTPEEKKWVEEQLNKVRTSEELKKAILKLGPGSGNWNVWFDKRIGAKLATCVMESEIYYKEVDEEGEYADSHFSEIKRGIIDIIKQTPQKWEIKEKEVPDYMFRGMPENERKSKDLVVKEKKVGGRW